MRPDKVAYMDADLIADGAEDLHAFFVGAFGVCGIVDGPMLAKADAGEDRASVSCAIAHRDDVGEMLSKEVDDILGVLGGDVDADLSHGLDGKRI